MRVSVWSTWLASPIRCRSTNVIWRVERVMAVNITGSFLMLRAAATRIVPPGRRPDRQHILHQRLGRRWHVLQGVYATAKAAVIGMCRGGARELGPYGITVNVLAPGPIDTEIMGGRLRR